MGGHPDEAERMSDDDLALSNYQRRAPHTAVNILRMTQVNAGACGRIGFASEAN